MTVVITGASRGIGFFAAEQLAARGARIILFGRSRTRPDWAQHHFAGSTHRSITLDCANLPTVTAAAREIRSATPDGIDLLIVNAAIHPSPHLRDHTSATSRILTTSYLSHASLTEALLPHLQRRPGARVIHVGDSITTTRPRPRGDIAATPRSTPRQAYALSKHALEFYGFDLDRRLKSSDARTISIVTHPGKASTLLTPERHRIHHRSPLTRTIAQRTRTLTASIANGKDSAASAIIRACLDPTLAGGEYIGSAGRTGPPQIPNPPPTADADLGAYLRHQTQRLLAGAEDIPR